MFDETKLPVLAEVWNYVPFYFLLLTPPGASAGRKSPKTFLTVDPRGRPYVKRHQKTRTPLQACGVYGTVAGDLHY